MFNKKCIKCNDDIKYGTIIKSYYFSNKPIKCENCMTLLQKNKASKFWVMLSIVLPAGFLCFLTNLSGIERLGILMLWFALSIFILPLFVKFHIENKNTK